ncbi:MAG: antibiotic biosynthesis monooxygenase [Proteobacteria bacterium]|nr:antibiotic biosynthesis monooxygenase [Pseudomonadota bacterium]
MYLVVFRNRKRADLDGAAYGADADRMVDLAQAQPGFLWFKSYTAEDGEVVAISAWADEAAALGWRRNAEHSTVQGRGRAEYYAEYELLSGPVTRHHQFPEGRP